MKPSKYPTFTGRKLSLHAFCSTASTTSSCSTTRSSTRGDFRNRNQIKTANGLKWITIPIAHSGVYPERVLDMRIGDPGWGRRHYEMIRQAYRGSPGWPVLDGWLHEILLAQRAPTLTEVNESLLRSLCGLLGIRTEFSQSVVHGVQCDDPTERLIRLGQAVGATHYVSGPSAKNYMREELFAENGMTFEHFDYTGISRRAGLRKRLKSSSLAMGSASVMRST